LYLPGAGEQVDFVHLLIDIPAGGAVQIMKIARD
jgi:hypothetical protein